MSDGDVNVGCREGSMRVERVWRCRVEGCKEGDIGRDSRTGRKEYQTKGRQVQVMEKEMAADMSAAERGLTILKRLVKVDKSRGEEKWPALAAADECSLIMVACQGSSSQVPSCVMRRRRGCWVAPIQARRGQSWEGGDGGAR